jgi:hypothetical protein
MNELAIHIESLLFARGRPLTHTELAQKLKVCREEVSFAVSYPLREQK